MSSLQRHLKVEMYQQDLTQARKFSFKITALVNEHDFTPAQKVEAFLALGNSATDNQWNKVTLPQFLHGLAKSYRGLGAEREDALDKIVSSSTYSTVISKMERSLSEFDGRGLSNTAWALATLKVDKPDLSRALANESTRKISEYNPQDLANTAWAFATLNLSEPKLFEALASETIKKIAEFNPQGLANTAWAFATLNINNPQLFETLASESVRRISAFNTQALANTAWAFATLNINNPELFRALAGHAISKISGYNPQDLTNTSWAFATLNINNPELFDALAAQSIWKMLDFNPQDLASTAWAFATSNMHSPELYKALAEESIRKISGFNPQTLANTAWAFATLNIHSPELFSELAQESVRKLSGFNPQDLANTAWAFATLNIQSPELFKALAEESVRTISAFNPQTLSNTAWALAIAAPECAKQFLGTCIESMARDSVNDFSQLLQLHQAEVSVALRPPGDYEPKLREMLSKSDEGATGLNSFEGKVLKSLESLLHKPGSANWHIDQHRLIDGIVADFVLTCGERRVVVECDGARYHFVGGDPNNQPLGKDVIQDRIFNMQGLGVLHIVYEEWIKIGDKITWLDERLADGAAGATASTG